MKVTDGIRRLLADARSTPILPEVEPGRVIFNRLWLLAVLTIGAGALAFLVPQVPAVATGYGLLGALGWRSQARPSWRSRSATACSSTSSARRRSSPTQLIRTPGYRKLDTLREPARDQARRLALRALHLRRDRDLTRIRRPSSSAH